MVIPLPEGSYTVNASKEFVQYDSDKDNLKDRAASLLVDIVPFLIATSQDLIVVDPGLGLLNSKGEYHIQENIAMHGHSVDDVSIVLLSHLHKDHAGGISYGRENAFNLMFPKAKYYCQEKEMEYAFTKKNSPSFLPDRLHYLKRTSNLELINGNGKIGNDIQYEISGGHTPFHQVFLIESDQQKLFFGGDVLPQPSQLQRKFIAKYDYDGKAASAKRIEYGNRAFAENWICLFFHSATISMARVKEKNSKFLIEKV
ncbi:MAG: MBL fold metallo-hydrolase [Chitinophagales bacterium]|nr:MBL fold metallo-hydrolase [Chitinophagales bacterium]